MELQGERSWRRATRPARMVRVKKQQRERCIDTEIGTFPVAGVSPRREHCSSDHDETTGVMYDSRDQEKPLLSFYMRFIRAIAQSGFALNSERESFKLAITNVP